MMIIPITQKSGWHNPPYLTILLILINCFVFFVFQGGEEQQMKKVTDFYSSSGLAKIEGPLYEEYLQKEGKTDKLEKYQKQLKLYGESTTYVAIAKDSVFFKKLQADKVVTQKQDIYPSWKQNRARIAGLYGEIFSNKYGHHPDQSSWDTPFTYMFLHGDTMHLVGNMVFLWLVGSLLELSCNRAVYLLIYLATGYFSALFFGWIYVDSSGPLIGASGAIAGLMGASAIIYGLGRVKIFYSLGFFFGYLRVPALLLLPLWIGKELFQLFYGGPSNVAFVGHLGGLLSGGALGYLQLKLAGPVIEEEEPEKKAQQAATLMEMGMAKLSNFDFAGARVVFAEILANDPQNLTALQQLYKIDRQNPQGKEFQQSAVRLLGLLSRKREEHGRLLLETYRDYCGLGGNGLPPELNTSLALSFAATGQVEEAARIGAFLLKNHPTFPGLPGCLLALAKALGRAGQAEKSSNCLKIICAKYPEAPEVRFAKQILEG